MFCSSEDVDLHVQDIFRDIEDEREKNLCGYEVAKLYYQVGEYDIAHTYVTKYLSVCEDKEEGQELLKQIEEKRDEKDKQSADLPTTEQSPLMQKGSSYRFSWGLTNGSSKDKGHDESFEEKDDTHFKPAVALPDLIEVTTGEENEEKLFSERARLFRYDSSAKEWKERGVGQMKILHHPFKNTYRLLLRREQVHKVVCNLLITANFQLKAMTSSDCAWLWAAVNFPEDTEPGIEKLAVRFRSADVAKEFKRKIEECTFVLEKDSSTKCNRDDAENDSSDEERENDSEAEKSLDQSEVGLGNKSEIDDCHVFEKKASLMIQKQDSEDFDTLGFCVIEIASIEKLPYHVIATKEDSEEKLCNILMDENCNLKLKNDDIILTGFDSCSEVPTKKTFLVKFDNSETRNEFSCVFNEAKDLNAEATGSIKNVSDQVANMKVE